MQFTGAYVPLYAILH